MANLTMMKELLYSRFYKSRGLDFPLRWGALLFVAIAIISIAVVFMDMPYIGPFFSLVIWAVALKFDRPIWLVAWWVATSNLFMLRFDIAPGMPELYYHQVILLILVVGWVVKKVITQDQSDHERYIWHSPVTKYLMVWLAICGVSSLWAIFFLSRDFYDIIYGFFALVILVCSYLIVANTATAYQQLKLILFAILFAGLVQRIVDTYLIIQEYGISLSYGQLGPVIKHNNDPQAWFAAAGFGKGGFLLLLAAATIFKDRKWKWTAMGLAIFYLLTSLLRGSRGGLISTLIIVLAVLLFRRRFILLVILGLVLLAVVIPSAHQLVSDYRMDVHLRKALGSRLALWTDAVRVIKEYPVFGAGIGSYDTFKQATLVSGTSRRFKSSSAHNPFLQMAGETGILSLLLFILFLGLYAWKSWRLYSSSNNPLFMSLGLGCLVWIVSGSLLGYGSSMIPVYTGMERFRWIISIAEFYIFLGLIIAASAIQRSESKEETY